MPFRPASETVDLRCGIGHARGNRHGALCAGRQPRRTGEGARRKPGRLHEHRVEFLRLARQPVGDARPQLGGAGGLRRIDGRGGTQRRRGDCRAVGEGADRGVDRRLRLAERLRHRCRRARLAGERADRRRQAVGDVVLGIGAHGGAGEVQRPAFRAGVAPSAHALGGVEEARPLADLGIAGAGHGIAAGRRHGDRRLRRRLLVVVGISRPRPCRQVELRHLPGFQPGGDLLGEGRGIGGLVEGGDGGAGHGAVVAVLAGHVEEGDLDDVRTVAAIGFDHAPDDRFLAPARQRVVAVLGEAEIEDAVVRSVADPGNAGIEGARRFLHFARPDRAERAAALRSERVLPAFAAGRAEDHHPHAEPVAERRQQAAVFVVRMGAGVHPGDHRCQPAERPRQAQERRIGLLAGDQIAVSEHRGLFLRRMS